MTLETYLAGICLPNPTILSAGVCPQPSLLKRAAKAGAGAVTTKSTSLHKKRGHPNPIIVDLGHSLLNAVGLTNPGVDKTIMEINRLSLDIPIIASIFGSTLDEISQVAKKINESKASLIELNISCPNVKGVPFASDPLLAKEAVKRAKEVLDIPLIAKLSPNVTNISQIAKAISRHVDAISAINTVGGMAIDIHAKAPILSNKFGGLSGPAIKPIGIKCVYEIYKSVDLPIIGMGGISTPEDAIEYLLAGATCVGIGSAIKTYDFSIFKKITQGMVDYLDGEPITKIIGAAHKTP